MDFEVEPELSSDVTEDDLADEVQPDSTVTWSTDWTVSTLIDQLRRGRFDLEPEFQRRDAWRDARRSRFIESLVLGIPVPQITLAERPESRGKFVVLDGKQRLRALQRFAGLDGPAMRLSGLEVLKDLNGATYEDFGGDSAFERYAAALDNASIRAVVLRGWKNESLLYLTFLRLNSNVVGLSPQELRRALHPGPFMDFVMDHSAASESIRRFLKNKGPDFRMRDAELLTRHVSLSLRTTSYAGNLRKFLDDSCNVLNQKWSTLQPAIRECAAGLDDAIDFTFEVFEADAFKRPSKRGYERSRNRAVLDAMAFYFQHLSVRTELAGQGPVVKQTLEDLVQADPEFASALTSTTKSVPAVAARLIRWGEAIAPLSPSSLQYVPTPWA